MAADGDSLGGLLIVVIVLAVAAAAMIRVFGWNYVKGWRHGLVHNPGPRGIR